MNHHRITLRSIRVFISMLLSICCFLPVNVSANNLTGLELSSKLNLSNTGEPWTDDWDVLDTEVNFPGGGQAGFYSRLTGVGDANPERGRTGILCLFPESRNKPARLIRRNVELTGEIPLLRLGVAANRNPRGEWRLTVMVNDRPLSDEVIIAGNKGWQDLSFDLTPYARQTVNIVIEAGSTGRPNGFVFIDYINIDDNRQSTVHILDPAEKNAAIPPSQIDKKIGLFDRAYQNFLNLLNIREAKRSQGVQDKAYQDQSGYNHR